MLYDFSDKHLKVVKKFGLDRLLRVNRFAEGYQSRKLKKYSIFYISLEFYVATFNLTVQIRFEVIFKF